MIYVSAGFLSRSQISFIGLSVNTSGMIFARGEASLTRLPSERPDA